ncbi:hypothetical protein HOY80DRAFT_883345 [Tuber brumale]|nr:hypothetical protein HOY80DRAFT_883345 [Tuber brumale]
MPGTNDSVPTPTDNGPPTEPSTPPQPPSISPPKSPHHPSKTDTHPNTQPTISLPIDRYILIASFACLFAILIYILPSLSPDLFPFHK